MTDTETTESQAFDDTGTGYRAVDVEAMECRYGSFTAVSHLDVTIENGQLYGLLGTNGAGKTTSIETMVGQRRAQGGRLRILGMEPYVNRRRLAGRMAVISQESGFATDLTVTETLLMWRRLHPGRGGPADPLEEVELAHRRDVRVDQLSGGERRRLDLALAISTAPELLFLDEPTTGLDPASRERTWQILRGLRERGCAILLTTHYLEEAEALSDRLAIMDRGAVAVSGTVSEVVSTHRARISCVLPPGELPALPELAGQSIRDGEVLTIRTPRLQADMYRLLAWADTHDLPLRRFVAAEASLREVFNEIQAAAEPSV